MVKFGVIFDLDGVLIDSTSHIPIIAQQVAAEMGVILTRAEREETTHLPLAVWVSGWNTSRNLAIDSDDVLKRYLEIESDYVKNNSILVPGVVRLLDELHSRDVLLAVATSSPRVRLDNTLRVTSIADYFSATVSIDDVTHGKPNPEPYLKASHLLKLSPKNCIGIEDTPTGLASIRGAGVKSIGYSPRPSIRQSFGAADLIVSSFSDLSFEKLQKLVQK